MTEIWLIKVDCCCLISQNSNKGGQHCFKEFFIGVLEVKYTTDSKGIDKSSGTSQKAYNFWTPLQIWQFFPCNFTMQHVKPNYCFEPFSEQSENCFSTYHSLWWFRDKRYPKSLILLVPHLWSELGKAHVKVVRLAHLVKIGLWVPEVM